MPITYVVDSKKREITIHGLPKNPVLSFEKAAEIAFILDMYADENTSFDNKTEIQKDSSGAPL